MTTQVFAGYATVVSAESDPRRSEAILLSRLTAAMIAASKAGRDGFAALAAALHDNRRFWRTVAADLAGDGNGLPPALRGQLLSLAGFVERETGEILAGKRDPEALIEVNRSIARGLFDQR